MKCQILFSGKNKKNIINLPSAENTQTVVKVKLVNLNSTSAEMSYGVRAVSSLYTFKL